MGMEAAGHKCVGHVEKDKYARKSYEAIYDVEGEWTRHDIAQVTNEEWRELRGKVDVICAGFPCQPFSHGGLRRGFQDTRGTLFFEIARAAKEIQPRFLLLENVKGLLSNEAGTTFGLILNTLDELGYDAEWGLLDSQAFGVPQHRERVFIVGYIRGSCTGEVFPFGRNTVEIDNETLEDVTNEQASDKLTMAISTVARLNKTQNGRRMKGNDEPMFTLTSQDVHGVMIREATKKGYSIAHEGDSINYTAAGSKTRRGRVGKGVANTLDTTCYQGVLKGCRIRKLTPKECWRLQGFPDWAYERAAKVTSENQLYKQAGNAVSVPVAQALGERLAEL